MSNLVLDVVASSVCLCVCERLLGGGGTLQSAAGCQSPVFSSSRSEGTLPVLAAHLHLKDFLVPFLILIGWQVYAWRRLGRKSTMNFCFSSCWSCDGTNILLGTSDDTPTEEPGLHQNKENSLKDHGKELRPLTHRQQNRGIVRRPQCLIYCCDSDNSGAAGLY